MLGTASQRSRAIVGDRTDGSVCNVQKEQACYEKIPEHKGEVTNQNKEEVINENKNDVAEDQDKQHDMGEIEDQKKKDDDEEKPQAAEQKEQEQTQKNQQKKNERCRRQSQAGGRTLHY